MEWILDVHKIVTTTAMCITATGGDPVHAGKVMKNINYFTAGDLLSVGRPFIGTCSMTYVSTENYHFQQQPIWDSMWNSFTPW